MADLPILAPSEPEKKKRGRPFGTKKVVDDPNKLSIDKSILDGLMDKMKALEQKILQGNKQGIETSAHRLLNKTQAPEKDMMEVQESIQVLDQPATTDGKYIKDACPFCRVNHKGMPTILDLTNSNKYACRRCGKHWEQWAVKKSELTGEYYPYSEALERGDKKRVEYQERIKMAKQGMAVGIVEGEEGDA